MIEKPSESEYAPFYAGYIARIPAEGVLKILERQSSELRRLASVASRGPRRFVGICRPAQPDGCAPGTVYTASPATKRVFSRPWSSTARTAHARRSGFRS